MWITVRLVSGEPTRIKVNKLIQLGKLTDARIEHLGFEAESVRLQMKARERKWNSVETRNLLPNEELADEGDE